MVDITVMLVQSSSVVVSMRSSYTQGSITNSSPFLCLAKRDEGDNRFKPVLKGTRARARKRERERNGGGGRGRDRERGSEWGRETDRHRQTEGGRHRERVYVCASVWERERGVCVCVGGGGRGRQLFMWEGERGRRKSRHLGEAADRVKSINSTIQQTYTQSSTAEKSERPQQKKAQKNHNTVSSKTYTEKPTVAYRRDKDIQKERRHKPAPNDPSVTQGQSGLTLTLCTKWLY